MGGVETGMGVEERDAGANEPMDGTALGVGGRDAIGSAQVERMVGDDHVDAGAEGLVDNSCHRVDCQQDALHRISGVSADETIGVP